jgi:zinc protease
MRTPLSSMLLVALTSLAASSPLGLAAPQAPAPRTPASPTSPTPGPVTSHKAIKYPPLRQFNVPRPTRFELPNGMVIYLLEDHMLPMVNAAAMIRVGSRWEPVPKAGLASITGEVLRTGGTKSRSGDELDDELDRLGAVIETSVGDEAGSATVSVLKEDADRGLAILADILANPSFPDDKIELAKVAERDAISRRNDDPASIAFREFNRVVYGRDSAYGHIPEYATIEAISRDDLVAFHKQFFQPENVILGVWGDFTAADMRTRVEKAFSSWPRGGQPRPEPPAVDAASPSKSRIFSIDKDDVNQSWVLVGGLSGTRKDQDYAALSVMNSILGGGMSSRLFSRIRTNEGLAYAVRSAWSAGWDHPGTFTVFGGTKTESTLQMLHGLRREVQALVTSGVTDDEVKRARDSVVKGLAFEFDSTDKIVRRSMTYAYYGYPADYLQQYVGAVEKVTKEDIRRVAGEKLSADFATLILGNGKAYAQPLSTLGDVTPIDIRISPPTK